MKNLLIEAISVGIMTGVLGMIICYLGEIYTVENQYRLFACLFSLGIVIHLLCELTGTNKWYCTNGNACSNST